MVITDIQKLGKFSQLEKKTQKGHCISAFFACSEVEGTGTLQKCSHSITFVAYHSTALLLRLIIPLCVLLQSSITD